MPSPVALAAFTFAVLCVLSPALMAQTPTPVPVLTWRYDLTHAGQNTQETTLTPANVNPDSFGKLFSLPVDSTVYAQPLYVPGLKMGDGQTHNVLFVATENDSVYAFDADSNGGSNAKPIWQISLLTADHGATSGATAVPWQDTGSPDVAPTVGITGTPVIDASTNTMYLVANTKENGQYYSRLHAINILNGQEQANSPVSITATVNGTGNGSSGGQITFSPLWENQRPALDLFNGFVYIGYGAHGDNGPWHGWLFSYDASTLAQKSVLCLTPNGSGAGVWAAGAGLPIDTKTGKMFVVTGNGTRNSPPFNASSEFGESVVAFDLDNGLLTPVDEFTSYNYQTDLNAHDWDQGSGGLLMLPDQPGSHPHQILTAGKEGRITLLDRDNLGGFASGASSNTNALQDISNVIPQAKGFWSTAAYWNNNVYMWAEDNVPMMFKMNGGVMDTEPDSQSTVTSAFPDPTFTISSNGSNDGIAWAVRSDQFNSDGAAVLYAWDANDLTKTIYESDTKSTRDAAGAANKFAIPVVTNGKVYVPCHGEVDVYGLLNGQPTAAAPVISPNGGTFSSTQSVTLSSSTSSAAIYYTLDGSTPTPGSTEYSGPISISSDTTLKAIASAPGYVQSGVSSATFTFTNQTPPVTFTPAPGAYVDAQSVTLADSDAGAKIYYTTDGSTPSASSSLYSAPIKVGVSETIKAIAIDPALANSSVSSAAYLIQNGGNTIDFSGGFASTAGLTLNGSTVATNDTRMQLTNGNTWQAGSVFWNAPINIQAFTTKFEFQLSNAQGNGFTFTVQNVGPTALGGNSAGLGYQGIQKSVAIKFNFYNYNNEGSDSTGFYTDGAAPTLPTIDISPSGIQLGSGDSIDATVTYDGTTLTLSLLDLVTNDTFTTSQAINIPQVVGGNTAYVGFTGGTGGLTSSQKLLSWVYSTQALPPAFSPAAGSYTSAQNVSLSSQSSDAAIYYTTDGSAPTQASQAYSGPIAVSSSETIKAVAISPTLGTSNIVTAAYVIAPGGGGTGGAFTLAGSLVNISAPGANGTSTITVTPSGGFTGSVFISCTLATTPANAVNHPTCSVTQPPAITSSSSVAGAVQINTTGSTNSASLHKSGLGLGAGATFAALLFLFVPRRRRAWHALLGLLLLAAAVVTASGCGASSVPTHVNGGGGGTTPGAYTFTITGTAGSTSSTTTLDVLVN